MDSYSFPRGRLRELQDPAKEPLVLVACGSYSPVTFLHLRMFEMARDHARLSGKFEVVAGYLSPVNDSYNKPGLVPARHRVAMCALACENTSEWIMVDDYESRQDYYVPTAQVLDHFQKEINGTSDPEDKGNCNKGIQLANDPSQPRRQARIVLLAGSDLIQTMSEPGVWAEQDLHHILGLYGCFIIQRSGTDIEEQLFSDSSVHSRSPLALYRHNIYTVQQPVRNDVSSTKIRLFLSRGMSVRYLIPECVISYIKEHNLYRRANSSSSFNNPSPFTHLTPLSISESSTPSSSSTTSPAIPTAKLPQT